MNPRFAKITALGCLAAGLAFAQAARPGRAAARPVRAALRQAAAGAIRQRMLQNLNLTADQKAQAKSIMQQARTQAQPMRTQLQDTRKTLATAVKSDPGQITNLSAKAGQIQGQLLAIREQATAQIYALLTPDQKTRFDQMEQRLRQRIEKRRSTGQPAAAPGN